MTSAVRAEALAKRYRLGGHRPGRLLYEEIGARLGRRGRAERPEPGGWIWALSDVSFEVAQGEVLGIVGRNGAGKSTLLRVLSRITEPTSGRAEVRGRLASLLEVGTGFHPELTGRENVYLNGAVLGLSKREISTRFDEIVAFAEVERFLDTPVKHFSSGMFMRLAFAVAAHLEPDVLVVDEVLAVGDAEFQRKCLGRMESIAESGRTVLFVSHNLAAVRSLCSSMLLLEGGRAVFRGPVEEGLSRYQDHVSLSGGDLPRTSFTGSLAGELRVERLTVRQRAVEVEQVEPGTPVTFSLEGWATRDFRSVDLALAFYRDGFHLFSCHDGPPGQPLPRGRFVSNFEFPASPFRSGVYTIGVGGHVPGLGGWLWAADVARVVVQEGSGEVASGRDVGALAVGCIAHRLPGEGNRPSHEPE